MANATTQVLSYALFVAISPIPLVAVVALLAGPNGRRNGVAFLLGWLIGLLVAGAVLVVILGAPDDSNESSSNAHGWLFIALGVLMFWLAVKQLRLRPQDGADPTLPSWLAKVDALNAWHAAALAAGLAVVNPKNLILIAGAATAAAQTGASTTECIEAMVVFAFVALIGPAIPVGARLFAGDRAEPLLAKWRAWLSRNSAVILAVICTAIAIKLLTDGIAVLT
jgi:threonine/homoserine/homoserine lactone efflux protein